ncbi:MAG: PAS domain S-box protein [Candidatus Marinimicrobia bacterium]|nr:PAS domain S-box protein [Candidatus Neomarinimicrobiota bacterium]
MHLAWLTAAVLASIIGTLALLLIFSYLLIKNHHRFLWFWVGSCAFFTIRYALDFATLQFPGISGIYYFKEASIVIASILLLWGIYEFLGKFKSPAFWLGIIAVSLSFILTAFFIELPLKFVSTPVFLVAGVISILTGIVFLQNYPTNSFGKYLFSFSLILWGVHKLDYPFLREMELFAPIGYALAGLLGLLGALGFILIYFEETRLELERSEQHFRLLAENARDVIFRYNIRPEISLEYISPSVEKLTGYSIDTLYNEENIETWLIYPEDRKRYREYLSEPSNFEHPIQIRWRHKNGSLLTIEQQTVPIFDEENRLIALEGIIRDVTERESIEQSLKHSERNYQHIIQNIPLGFCRISKWGKFLMVNETFARMLGYESPGDMEGLDFRKSDFCEHVSFEQIQNYLKNNSELPVHSNSWYSHTGDPIATRDIYYAVYDSNNNLLHYEGIVADATKQVELENQLRQSQKMEAIGQLAGGIAHDFNNLLTVINGYSSLLLSESTNSGNTKALQSIYDAGKHAEQMTTQLLAFSRKQELEFQYTNLNGLLERSIKMIRRLVHENIQVQFTSADSDCHSMVDPTQMEQVFFNLAINARDAMPEGGVLDISIKYPCQSLSAIPDLQESKNYICIRFADSGCGMDEETLSRIFEPFYTTKESGKGTGLGLATVYGIIQQTGGYIDVRSEPGKGSEFIIYLPDSEEPQKRQEKTKQITDQSSHQKTILVAEDEPTILELIEIALSYNGNTVLTAKNSAEATRIARDLSYKIDLLITDVVLPDEPGPNLAKSLHENRPEAQVIYISGYDAGTLNSYDVSISKAGFIRKPFGIDELRQKVQECLLQKEE